MNVPIDEIQKGGFVCMWQTGLPTEWWCEVIQVLPRLKEDRTEYADQQYQVRYWSEKKNQWDYFHLAPNTAHRGMVKKALRVDPAVAVIFRSNMKSTV